MSWCRRSSTASQCSRISWYHLIGWYVVQRKIGKIATWMRWNIDRMRKDCPASPPSSYFYRTLRLYWTDTSAESRKAFDRTRLLSSTTARIIHSVAWYYISYRGRGTSINRIESGYHWNADVPHRSTVFGGGIVSDNRGEQMVVLVGNLQIGGSDQRWIHLDHLAISSDINYVRCIEESE